MATKPKRAETTVPKPVKTHALLDEQHFNRRAHLRKKAMARDPREEDYSVSVPGVKHLRSSDDSTIERVISSGVIEALPVTIGAAGAAWFIDTRQSRLGWAAGTLFVTFLVAGGARNNSFVRDAAIGVLGGASAVGILDVLGLLK